LVALPLALPMGWIESPPMVQRRNRDRSQHRKRSSPPSPLTSRVHGITIRRMYKQYSNIIVTFT
jgi:hypothetical protein